MQHADAITILVQPSMNGSLWGSQVSTPAQEAAMDPAAARKAEEEAEERRIAEIRSHGTMVTPQTFAEWKARFDAEMALARCCPLLAPPFLQHSLLHTHLLQPCDHDSMSAW